MGKCWLDGYHLPLCENHRTGEQCSPFIHACGEHCSPVRIRDKRLEGWFPTQCASGILEIHSSPLGATDAPANLLTYIQ